MGIDLEGTQVEVVTTAAKTAVSKAYHVTVSDGQLTVRLKGPGGSNKTAAMAALSVTDVAPQPKGCTPAEEVTASE